MNKNESPAVIYYHILEQKELIKKEIGELNKSIAALNMLNSKVGEGPVDIQQLVDGLMIKQIELDVQYRTAERELQEDGDIELV